MKKKRGKKNSISDLKAIFLIGTLKKKPVFSHTDTLCEYLAGHLKKRGVKSKFIRLANYKIEPGIETHVQGGDDWPKILKQILDSDIIIFATPIWWGVHSSLTQRIIERMDALNDELLETGKSDFNNKVGGIVITGAEDGAQHIIGNFLNFFNWNDIVAPPECSLSYLGSYAKTKKKLLKQFDKGIIKEMASLMAHNLTFYARLLKENPLPTHKATDQNIRPGAVGFGQ